MLHGHWHHAHESELSWIDRVATEESGALAWRSTRLIGLGCDGDMAGGWLLVLDPATLDVGWPTTATAHSALPGTTELEVEVEP